ncbi:STAS domain-containing protein [Streptomyces sp.]|uniref:STAS domain-containing protein n=1 Tax=Streptomyces sp. TaxID=1931 RepID=UPI002D61D29F|nr:STAS domain-containing protein [Streptomyces sp.]HZF88237.1 STAS domain-containing protein [Streptomyces sp.]
MRVALVGEADPATAPPPLTSLERGLQEGTRTVAADLTAATFCDVSGPDVFLAVPDLTTEAGMTLRLHRPPQCLTRVIDITGSGFPRPALLPVRTAAPAPAAAGGVL